MEALLDGPSPEQLALQVPVHLPCIDHATLLACACTDARRRDGHEEVDRNAGSMLYMRVKYKSVELLCMNVPGAVFGSGTASRLMFICTVVDDLYGLHAGCGKFWLIPSLRQWL